MTINVAGLRTTVQDSFRDQLEAKLGRFDKFFEDNAEADVKVINEGGRETVEITIFSDGMVFRSERTTDDRLTSLDQVMDALNSQISKNKSKLKAKMRQSSFDEFPNGALALGHRPEDDDEYRIVKSKQFILKPMDAQEAILQMNMLGHNFFMFRNSETEEVSVIYKRDDGDYGLIEPAHI